MEVGLFDRDGSVREVHLPVASSAWPDVVAVILGHSNEHRFTMDGSIQPMPGTTEELLRVDGHVRVLAWWLGRIECRTYLIDPDEFLFDFRPVDTADDTERLRQFLDALAVRFGVSIRICHEHGDHGPVVWM